MATATRKRKKHDVSVDDILIGLRTLGKSLDEVEAATTALKQRIWKLSQKYSGLEQSHAYLFDAKATLEQAEHEIALDMQRQWRFHPLSDWCSSVVGLGERSIARLIAEIGDPSVGSTGHWVTVQTDEKNTRGADMVRREWVIDSYYDRMVSQLWQYCGVGDPETSKLPKKPTQEELLRRGRMRAKKQLYIIASAFIKNDGKPDKNGKKRAYSPYRGVYDRAREKYADRVHDKPCQQCAGRNRKPELALGTPWKDGHKHMAALRKTEKEFLRDLWVQARLLRGLEI